MSVHKRGSGGFCLAPVPAITLLLLIILILAACASNEPPGEVEPLPKQDDEQIRAFMVERGRLLVELGGCGECHTPKVNSGFGMKPRPGRFLSGYPEGEPLPDFPYTDFGEPGTERAFYTTDGTIWAGSWGVSFAANITPDPETGIGRWTDKQFISTFRTGTHIGQGRALFPPMPVKVYSQLSHEEIRSIFLYLQTIEPVRNKVPVPISPDDELFQE